MSTVATEFYTTWLQAMPCHLQPAGTLREGPPDFPRHEIDLQRIWQHQRFKREGLRLTDGTPIRILHPGFLNRGAGPDFSQAMVQFGQRPPCSGNVEVDLYSRGWTAHGHDRNPMFAGVMLHVIWRFEPGAVVPRPSFEAQAHLDAPWTEIAAWLDSGTDIPASLAGLCAASIRGLAPEQISGLLEQASLVRLRRKTLEFVARARESGWNQALIEGLFGGLGFQRNTWPMRRLAELVPRMLDPLAKRFAENQPAAPLRRLQSLLFALAGFLPADVDALRRDAKDEACGLWDCWWREQVEFADHRLPQEVWRLAGIRPANHPQRRLALAAHWVLDTSLPGKLEHWLVGHLPGNPATAAALHRLLQAGGDSFWERHWTFRSQRMNKTQPLLGRQRAIDLAMNVILPWLWARAECGGNHLLREQVEQHYLAWPKGQDNAVLRLARLRLFDETNQPVCASAAAQQGLLQVVRDFCGRSNALCEGCEFPETIQQLLEL